MYRQPKVGSSLDRDVQNATTFLRAQREHKVSDGTLDLRYLLSQALPFRRF